MSNALRKKIESIDSEVSEFHPFLETLFRNMPSVENVEYTQGPNEMGADFVLTTSDSALGDNNYVGVVVKIGKIKSNMTEVERQIEECRVRRFVDGGKKEIYLSEVWVVANGTISQQAKVKIWEKFKSSNVKFVDINKLTDLSSKYAPFFGSELHVGIANYLREERVEAEKREQVSSLIPTDSGLYLEQDVVEISSSDIRSGKDRKVDFCREIFKGKFHFIEAPMGGGKSKLINVTIGRISEEEFYLDKKAIPVYLRAASVFSNDEFSIENIAGGVISDKKIPNSEYSEFVFFFDGMDEINLNDEDVARKFSEICNSIKDAVSDNKCNW